MHYDPWCGYTSTQNMGVGHYLSPVHEQVCLKVLRKHTTLATCADRPTAPIRRELRFVPSGACERKSHGNERASASRCDDEIWTGKVLDFQDGKVDLDKYRVEVRAGAWSWLLELNRTWMFPFHVLSSMCQFQTNLWARVVRSVVAFVTFIRDFTT